jgi:hypothetical protein
MITLQQGGSGQNGAGSTSVAASFSSGVSTPDFVVVVLFDANSRSSYSVTDDQNNTSYSQVLQQSNSLGMVTVWTINAPNNFQTVTVSCASSMRACLITMDFQQLSSGMMDTSTSFTSSSSPWSGTSFTTNYTDLLLGIACNLCTSTPTWAATGIWNTVTSIATGGGFPAVSMFIEWQTESAGSYSPSGTISSGTVYSLGIAFYSAVSNWTIGYVLLVSN